MQSRGVEGQGAHGCILELDLDLEETARDRVVGEEAVREAGALEVV